MLADLRALVEAAHRLGIKVIQDQVANTRASCTPVGGRSADAHVVQRHRGSTPRTPGRRGRCRIRTPSPQTRRETLDGWFIDILPDLNQQDDEVARIIQNSLWWVGVLGLDGIRQDIGPYVPRAFGSAGWRP